MDPTKEGASSCFLSCQVMYLCCSWSCRGACRCLHFPKTESAFLKKFGLNHKVIFSLHPAALRLIFRQMWLGSNVLLWRANSQIHPCCLVFFITAAKVTDWQSLAFGVVLVGEPLPRRETVFLIFFFHLCMYYTVESKLFRSVFCNIFQPDEH